MKKAGSGGSGAAALLQHLETRTAEMVAAARACKVAVLVEALNIRARAKRQALRAQQRAPTG